MTAIFSQSLDPATALTANRQANLTAPLFDPVYVVGNNGAITFSRSSPWPHLMQDFRRQNSGLITYEKSQVLTPFGVSTLEWGSTSSGTATGNAHAGFYANKDIVLSGGPTLEYHPNNVLAVAGTNSTRGIGGPGFNGSGIGTGAPSYRNFDPYFMWSQGGISWAYANLNICLDYLALDSVGDFCDALIPFSLVSGLTPQVIFGALTQNFWCWKSIITPNILRLTNAFSNGLGKNLFAVELNTSAHGGTALYLLSFDGSKFPSGPNSNLVALQFDDVNIQNLVNGLNVEIQGTNFGWLISWSKASYELIKGQGTQCILLSCTVDPSGNTIRNPVYAPVVLQPRTNNTGNLASLSTIANMKIDPNGILFMRGVGGGSDPTFVANSQGLDISIPGVNVDMSKVNGNLSIPSFCPCSPVAVPIGGA